MPGEAGVDSRLTDPTLTGASYSVTSAPEDTIWYDRILKASDRIASLARDSQQLRDPKLAVATVSRQAEPGSRESISTELRATKQALQDERFGEALTLLSQLPPETQADPEALLLRAVLLTNRGDIGSAREVLNALLSIDGLNPGAHYLAALCSDQSGRIPEAIEHYRSATYLNPAFAMAHLQLGRLARQNGDLPSARRELSHAWELFHREDPATILLFGGGFGRAALLDLCRAELRALGDTS
jgi:chemotaxis protein methyltransferase CheR